MKMDRIVVGPNRVDGIVWMTASVDGFRFEVGAARSGEWRIFHMPVVPTSYYYSKASALAEAYEREHAAELAALFAEAEAQQKKT